tara:strand:- start:122 stop:364 length:243 start_codon:yes stop_codon:yes gene_type:complete
VLLYLYNSFLILYPFSEIVRPVIVVAAVAANDAVVPPTRTRAPVAVTVAIPPALTVAAPLAVTLASPTRATRLAAPTPAV